MCFDHQCSKDCEEKELILRNGLKQNSVHYNPNPNPTSTKLQSCMIQFRLPQRGRIKFDERIIRIIDVW